MERARTAPLVLCGRDLDAFEQHQTLEQEEPPKWDFLKNNKEENSKGPDLSESDIELAYEKIFRTSYGDLPRAGAGSPIDFEDEKNRIPDNLCNGYTENGNPGSDNEEAKATRNDRNWKLCHSAKITVNEGPGFMLSGKLTKNKSEAKSKDKILEAVLPESLKGMGQENIIRFLKAKVRMMAEQLEVLQSDEKKHIEKIKELQSDRDRVTEDRDKWIQQANMAKNVLVRHEQQASSIVVRMQNIQAENGHLKREVEKLKKELKQATQYSGSNEVRLNRSIEEVEKLKVSLRQAKQDEKDLREAHRKKAEELSGAVKRLDKQRIELLHAFKKQLVIIDNLKKQKGLIEAGKFVKSVEDDFMDFLDWNPGNT
ncbi:UNVERIFIED_CONTAM: hypothetical protein PYX00_009904 [Menopon gallinae]|uniref:Testis expressed 9 n=1 Tax=Menopon gallinae TaxID=328185 RepID=A0AAW2HD40_9NEOP